MAKIGVRAPADRGPAAARAAAPPAAFLASRPGAEGRIIPDPARGSAWITAQLRQAILEGAYAHGEKLPAERQLAEAFGASRTTVRIALGQLEEERLVIRRVGSGTFVNHRSRDETENIAEVTSPIELIEVRLGVEPHMVRLAVLNATARDMDRLQESVERMEAGSTDAEAFTQLDEQFHLMIAESTHNPLMVWIYRQINDVRCHAQWAQMKDKVLTPERIAEYNRQHRNLFETIRSRDVEGAVAIVTNHLHYARRQLLGAASD
jgi:DNA-binding FadR family transcriptional regulator